MNYSRPSGISHTAIVIIIAIGIVVGLGGYMVYSMRQKISFSGNTPTGQNMPSETTTSNMPKDPPGTVIKQDGAKVVPDGTIVRPDGVIIHPDGTMEKPSPKE